MIFYALGIFYVIQNTWDSFDKVDLIVSVL